MIVYEEQEWEREVLDGGFDTAIPLSVSRRGEEEPVITAYRAADTTAHALEERMRDARFDCFSEDALHWLDGQLRPLMARYGFCPDEKRLGRWIYDFELTDPAQVRTEAIRPDTVRVLDPEREGLTAETFYRFDCELDADDVYFCTVDGGRIVSVANINTYPEGSRIREIGVETCGAYRRRGCAASNAAALARYLAERGYVVQYRCHCRNEGSRRVAERAGFACVGKSYHYVCYQQ